MSLFSLREPGAILLVSCYELGHQPLGLAWPLAFLQRAGFAPDCLDLSAQPLDEEKVRRARLIAVSVPMHTALRLGARAAQRMRRVNPTATVCFFGLYAALNADYLLDGLADVAVAGEHESALVALAERLETGPEAPSREIRLEKLDFPVPGREPLLPLSSYVRLEIGRERRVTGYVEASRGCLHGCLHCPIPPVYGGRFFVVPREVVMEDIRRQVAMGARHVTFGDPDFLNGPGHSLKVARGLHAEFPEVSFDFTAKVEHLLKHAGLLPEFRALGCAFIVTAVESLSDVVLANLQKGHTRSDVERLLPLVRRAGIALRPSLLPFTPWSGLDDYLDLLDWVEREDLIEHVDPVQYSIRLLVPPGSRLLGTPQLKPYLGSLDEAALSHRWTHPDPRMDRLQVEVSRLVRAAAGSGREAVWTFERIGELAFEMAGRVRTGGAYNRPLMPRARPPRLSEPWFC